MTIEKLADLQMDRAFLEHLLEDASNEEQDLSEELLVLDSVLAVSEPVVYPVKAEVIDAYVTALTALSGCLEAVKTAFAMPAARAEATQGFLADLDAVNPAALAARLSEAQQIQRDANYSALLRKEWADARAEATKDRAMVAARMQVLKRGMFVLRALLAACPEDGAYADTD